MLLDFFILYNTNTDLIAIFKVQIIHDSSLLLSFWYFFNEDASH